MLKNAIYEKPEEIASLTLERLHVHTVFSKYKSVLGVLRLLATIPCSTAEVERGFSAMTVLKTELRSLLTNEHLNELLAIKMLTPDVGLYNPEKAMDLWWGNCERRPDEPVKKVAVVVEENIQEDTVSPMPLQSSSPIPFAAPLPDEGDFDSGVDESDDDFSDCE